MGIDIPCVGAVIFDADGRLLLIRRAQEPARGLWSLPGGRVEPGESDAEAVIREIREETGLEVAVEREVGVVTRALDSGDRYVIRDFLATVVGGGSPVAGDDADDAAFVHPGELADYDLSPGLVEALAEWGLLAVDEDTGSVGRGA